MDATQEAAKATQEAAQATQEAAQTTQEPQVDPAPPPPPDPFAALRNAVDQMRSKVHLDIGGRLHLVEQAVGHMADLLLAHRPQN